MDMEAIEPCAKCNGIGRVRTGWNGCIELQCPDCDGTGKVQLSGLERLRELLEPNRSGLTPAQSWDVALLHLPALLEQHREMREALERLNAESDLSLNGWSERYHALARVIDPSGRTTDVQQLVERVRRLWQSL